MRVQIDNRAREEFVGDGGETLVVSYANAGEPYRQGVSLTMFEGQAYGSNSLVRVDLLEHEADRLLQCLARLRGKKLT